MSSRRGAFFWTPTKKHWCESTNRCLWHDASGQCHDEGDCSVYNGLPDACTREDACYYHCDTQLCNKEPHPDCSKYTNTDFSPELLRTTLPTLLRKNFQGPCEATPGCVWEPFRAICSPERCGRIKYEEDVPKPSVEQKWVKVCRDNNYTFPPPDCRMPDQNCSTDCLNMETWKDVKLCGNVECDDERVEDREKMEEWMKHGCKYDQDIYVGKSVGIAFKEIEIGWESDPHTHIVCGKCDSTNIRYPRTEYCTIDSPCDNYLSAGYDSYEECTKLPHKEKCKQFTDEELLEIYWDQRSCYGINLAEEGTEANIFGYNSRLPSIDTGAKGRRRRSGYQDFSVKRVFKDGKELLHVTKLRGLTSGWELGPVFKCDLFRGACPAMKGWSGTGWGTGNGTADYEGMPGFDVTSNPGISYR